MKKYIIIAIILILNITPCFSQISEYKAFLAKEILTGVGNGKLMYTRETHPSGSTGFKILKNHIYIMDTLNFRLAIFQLPDFKFIKNVEYYFNGEKLYNFPYEIRIDKDKNIALYGYIDGIMKINSKYNFEFYISNQDLRINSNILNKRVFIINGYIIYYNENENIVAIDNEGNLKNVNDTKNFLINLGMYKGFSTDEKINTKFEKFIDKNNYIYINGQFYTERFTDFYDYRNFCFTNFENIKDKRRIDILDLNLNKFFGIDKNNNYYWGGDNYILVASIYGEIIDCLKKNVNAPWGSVDKYGNIYLLDRSSGVHRFYRIPNTWDPIDDSVDNTLDTPTPPKALSITASSFIDWKNTYTPYRAFDSNLKTGWLEAVKGPGTGESITLTLDREITVDEIKIAPGYFDPKWWKSNNRVKDLRVMYGNKSLVLHFKDVMQMQKAKLKKDIHFSDITFEITGVFPSGKDNDTGISEIEFYYKGEKIEIDVSGVK